MKVAVYSGTENIYIDMMTSVKSLLINSDVDLIYLLIETDEFPFVLPDNVKTINMSKQTYFAANGANMNTSYTYMCLLRSAYAKIFPQYDRILSLDSDTIIDKDISDLWDLPIDDYYFAASRETHRSYAGYIYANAGVTLFNLKKLRDDKKVDELIHVLNTTEYTWIDQDVNNYLCQGRIYDMPSCYNVNDWTVKTDDVKIKHFAGIKHFQNDPLYLKYRSIPLSEIRKDAKK